MTIPVVQYDTPAATAGCLKHTSIPTTAGLIKNRVGAPLPVLPWRRTPLIESRALSSLAGCRVFMKMEIFQPSGSFKSRGIGNFCLTALSRLPTTPSPDSITFFASSGGNAGLAAVIAARSLNQLCTVVVPEPTTEYMRGKLRAAGGEVVVCGNSWMECDAECRRLLELERKKGGMAIYVPPFDDAAIWEGHSWMVDEIVEDLEGVLPDGIVTAVGGGGLFNGIMQGLERVGGSGGRTAVVAMETEGADSLYQSTKEGELVTLPAITSIATSLGARRVSGRTWELAQRKGVVSRAVSDAQAASACCRFLEDERIAVEVSCGAALAAVYSGTVKEALPKLGEENILVMVVCGGNSINLDIFEEYRRKYHEPLMAALNP